MQRNFEKVHRKRRKFRPSETKKERKKKVQLMVQISRGALGHWETKKKRIVKFYAIRSSTREVTVVQATVTLLKIFLFTKVNGKNSKHVHHLQGSLKIFTSKHERGVDVTRNAPTLISRPLKDHPRGVKTLSRIAHRYAY